MNRASSLLLAWLLLSASASAADRLESARAQAAQARAQESELLARQARLKGELDALGGRIEALKAQAPGKLLPGAELDASLKHSQELSGALTSLAAAVEHAHGDTGRAHAELAAALSDELARLRAAWDGGSREERVKLLERMRALRAERESLRAALPPAQVPALLPAPSSDDPEELLEQADAYRDAQDKVKKRLSALETRITEAREERELDRRMGEFSHESSVFDEQDRRLRLDRDPHQREYSTFSPSTGPTAAGGAMSDSSMGTPEQMPSGPALSRPPTGAFAGAPGAGGEDELKSLEAERAQLRELSGELEHKAAQLEQRARALK